MFVVAIALSALIFPHLHQSVNASPSLEAVDGGGRGQLGKGGRGQSGKGGRGQQGKGCPVDCQVEGDGSERRNGRPHHRNAEKGLYNIERENTSAYIITKHD